MKEKNKDLQFLFLFPCLSHAQVCITFVWRTQEYNIFVQRFTGLELCCRCVACWIFCYYYYYYIIGMKAETNGDYCIRSSSCRSVTWWERNRLLCKSSDNWSEQTKRWMKICIVKAYEMTNQMPWCIRLLDVGEHVYTICTCSRHLWLLVVGNNNYKHYFPMYFNENLRSM